MNEQVIADKLEKILVSQARTESFITIIESRGCGFGGVEREKIKQSIRSVEDEIDIKIESQSKWLKGMAAGSFVLGLVAAWFNFKK